jgi:hypothetical protein
MAPCGLPSMTTEQTALFHDEGLDNLFHDSVGSGTNLPLTEPADRMRDNREG